MMISLIQFKRRWLAAGVFALAAAPGAFALTTQTPLQIFGAQAQGIAVDPANNECYSLWISGTASADPVAVFDPATGAVARTLPAASSPFQQPAAAVVARGGLVVGAWDSAPLVWVDKSLGATINLGSAVFESPSALAADTNGNLFIADANGVFRLDGSNNKTALGANTNYWQPSGVAVDDAGRVWVADTFNQVIKIIPAGGSPTAVPVSVAGMVGMNGVLPSGSNLISGSLARFNAPKGICWVGGQTGLLVCDYANNALRNVVYSNNTFWVGTVVSNLNGPVAVAVDNDGRILVADSRAGAIRALYRDSVPAPGISGVVGTLDNAVQVSFSTSLSSAHAPVFHYTLDGTIPTPLSPSGTSVSFDGGAGTNTARTVCARCFSPDFMTSVVVSNSYSFLAANPVIAPAGGTFDNTTYVYLSSDTSAASLYYTLDGSEPSATNGAVYPGPFILSSNATLKVRAVKPGYADSATVSNAFVFIAATPTLSPSGGTFSTNVPVEISCDTIGASLRYTLDGSEPTGASALYAGPLLLRSNCLLAAKAFHKGFTDSDAVAAMFSFVAATPVITAPLGIATNFAAVSAVTATPGARLRYTLDGTVPTNTSPLWADAMIRTNSTISIRAFLDGYTPSDVAVYTAQIQADAPVISPAGGYYPEGVTVSMSVLRADSVIYYTIDGSAPTTNSAKYSGPFRLNQALYRGVDMTSVSARAYAVNTLPSGITTGQSASSNSLGVDRDLFGGIGASLVVPVSMMLSGTQAVRSLQYRIEIAPASPGAPALARDIEALDVLTSDFCPIQIPLSGGGTAVFQAAPYTNGLARGILCSFLGSGSTLNVSKYGVVANLKIPIPLDALEGDVYTVQALGVSATSDAGQNAIAISSMPSRTLTVSNISYIVGETAPGGWYNAGDFGDGVLGNADVNNIFDASLGIHIPPNFSDVFDAMDVFPPDSGFGPGGDGEITELDWQHALLRSAGLETQMWSRHRAVGGGLVCERVVVSAKSERVASVKVATSSASNALPGLVWFRNARIESTVLTNAAPGKVYLLPVIARVKPGSTVAGLQFRASVAPNGGAPALADALTFIPAAGISAPISTNDGLDVVCAWAVYPTQSFDPTLVGSNLLGYIQWKAPAGAAAGQSYRLSFSHCDGIPDLETRYYFESRPVDLWILSAALASSPRVSDEWKVKFFGSASAPEADDDADPDGDGVPNWREYLAGTNPTNAQSRLCFSSAQWTNAATGPAPVLRWLSAPGVNYFIESASTLDGTGWTALTNTPGTGETLEAVDAGAGGRARFYRIRAEAQ